ncbi:ankyrin repeat domain-containing protein [Rhodoferax ferrireducens]|uniref:ankyrin repeat domain-containing protein n=1 Tax=Rhodoferax ferrireducens TaxID=192843 RepID=UPI00286CD443|nr:ankyrin repeat domain-containing protein [Rhodoferax ferrireducens]
MRLHLKKLVYLVVLAGFSLTHAGSFEDFFIAIKRDNAGTIQSLLKRGFDGNTSDEQGQSGLYLALKSESLKAANTLLDWPKIEVETRTAKDESPLMIAALAGELEICQKLIAKGADVNKTGWTPLHYAATRGHIEVIRLLLENSAYIDAASPNATTPLMMAAQYGTTAAVKLLLEEGADATLKNQRGLTALDFAQNASRPDAVEVLTAAMRTRRPKGTW